MPPGTQAVFAAALRHHQTGRLDEAERLYRQILQADPNHADALHFLGVIAHQRGSNEAALELLNAAIAQNGRVASFHNNLGNVLKALGRLDEAVASYRRALTLKPDHAEAHANLGSALQGQGQLESAAAAYRQALSLKPGSAETHNNLGNTLQAQGKLDEAVAAYARALALRPAYAEAHGNLGNVLKAQGLLEDAVASYRRALALKPDYAQAHNNLGIVLLEQESLDEAVASFGRALALKPDYVEAQTHLGHALKEQGLPEEAQAAYRRALALNPDDPDARLGLAIAAIPLMPRTAEESTAAVDAFSRALGELTTWSRAHRGILGRSVGRNQPFYLAYRPRDVSSVLARYGDLMSTEAADYRQGNSGTSPAPRREARMDQPAVSRPSMGQPNMGQPNMGQPNMGQPNMGQPNMGQRIRMVIVSGQVRRHPAWDMILRGIIAHLDRRQFEMVLYHTSSIVDEETRWANAHVDRFVQGPRSMRGWLEELTSDRPDVIFYPEIGMDPATCSLAALRLAPLQIASWGHPTTTGLPTIDMFLSGELLEGPAAERHYRERLVRLPGTGVCTEMAAVQTQPWDGPPRHRGTIRFALCQQPIKFDPADDALWVRIAQAAGSAEFWLASPHKLRWATKRLHERLGAAFRAAGLDPQSVHVMPWLPRERFMAFLDDMDVYLDCPAFSGYTTAWQAVHRGLPIVTLEGEFLRQRLAAGLLRQIGQPEGIAQSPEQYVGTAARWSQEARDSPAWASRREILRSAAGKADGNRLAVSALQQVLTEALRGA
jgi:predicted O-linked N-acetylglucosamine transferase (SPINDLY family)